jgi:hypothetical protein
MMARRQLLTNEERQALLGIPLDPDGMARRFTLSRADQDLVAGRRRDNNRIGFAVQLALLRYPGVALAQPEQPVEPLVRWLAKQLEVPAEPFDEYAHRPQTMTDHARLLATSLGLRPSVTTDLPMMIEAAAQAAWGTDRGHPIATAVVSALRAARVILPAAGVIERAAIAVRQSSWRFLRLHHRTPRHRCLQSADRSVHPHDLLVTFGLPSCYRANYEPITQARVI